MGSSASQYFEIPKYFVFSEKGIFAGSASERDFNYKIIPNIPKEGEKSLRAYIWSGELCLEKSENTEMKEFPLSEEGHAQMLNWLEEEYLKRDEVKVKFVRQQDYAHELCEKYVDLDDYLAHNK